jgi:anti-sigma regulatory factor (Ser/Thr protein kinase)
VIHESTTTDTTRPALRFAALALPAVPVRAREARHWARSALTRWAVDESVIDDALLVIAELTANAVQHGGRDMSVGLLLDRTLRVSVVDNGGTGIRPARPRSRLAFVPAENGRGLDMVRALSLSCVIDCEQSRTKVLAVLAADPADRAPVSGDSEPAALDAELGRYFDDGQGCFEDGGPLRAAEDAMTSAA